MKTRIWIPLSLLCLLTSVVLGVGVRLALEEFQVLQSRYHRLHQEELLSIRENIARMTVRRAAEDPDTEIPLADIIPFLPKNGDKSDIGRGSLLDEHGHEQYAWGADRPTADFHPLISLPLFAPLDRWELQYSMPREFWTRRLYGSALLTVLPSSLLVLLLLLALSHRLLSVHRRELGDAALRMNFVNQVSHELKTPLTNIRMYAEILAERLPESQTDDERACIRVILSESERLSRLITNVLTFGRRARGERQPLRKLEGIPAELIDEVLRDFAPRFQKAGLRAEQFIRDRTPVRFDRDALKQILFNLLSNVEKYAAEGKYVALKLLREGSELSIDVFDQGPGIRPPMRAEIFEPFSRAPNELAGGAVGSGLGLTISRELARLHGGDVRLLDSARGARFRVTLRVEVQPIPEVQDEGADLRR